MSQASVSIGNYHIPMPRVHAVQPPMLGMILYRYNDEFYIAKIVFMSCPVVKSEDSTVICSIVLTQYRHVTDRRTDRIAVAYRQCSAQLRAVK